MKKIIIGLLVFIGVLHCQERYVEIEGQKWRVKTIGEGTVTVVFENGMSDSLEIWGSIPDSVARFGKVFLYDRADIAKSDRARQKRTIPNTVEELRTILQHEKIQPPYILVGHSLGGVIDRYFASKYPEEVKGMLLLDPSPESFWEQMSESKLEEYILGGNEWYETKFPEKYRDEWYEFIPNLEYMKDLSIQEDLPVILVSATAWEWAKYQKPMIKGLKNARQVILEGSHHIYHENPDSTISYIKELLSK